HVDRERLEQILLNILGNAVKFTPEGGAITLTCEPADRVVDIRVKDTGRGIPRDKLDSIFEPFVQVDTRLTREPTAAGLAVTSSLGVARVMGGDLCAESAAGQGATFVLRLRRAAKHSSESANRE